jgi:hypothetical protein
LQVLRDEIQQDNTIRDLGVSLRDVLAFGHEACDLQEIKGGLDVIKEMGLAIQDCAKLIQEYIDSPFFCENPCSAFNNNPRTNRNERQITVRAAKSSGSGAMAGRIQGCKNRFAYLNGQFDRAVGVQTWTAVGKLLSDSANKGESLRY